MATEKQWIVRYKHYVSPDAQSEHVTTVKALTDDTATPFSVAINEEAKFSIGHETKGYLAKFDDDTKAQLEALPEVYEIEELQYYKHVSTTQEDAPWGLARLNSTGPLKTDSNYVYTYRSEASGAGVTAYIIDTGINDKHVDFEGRAKKGPVIVQGGSGDTDVHGHGTHVAGTIGGKTYGVAKKVDLIGIKVFDDSTGSASTIDIIQALEWVVNDKNSTKPPKKAVANLSLGGRGSRVMDAAVAAAVREGVVVVVAAGNENVDADAGSPAREPLAITVGAIDIKDSRANFSNYGRLIDIFAPGVEILSAWIAEPGAEVTNREEKRLRGTSMASPHVAGVAASILSDTQQQAGAIMNAQDVISTMLIKADKSGVGNLSSSQKPSTIGVIAKL